ncbi:MFS transporter (macronuclear) [Tetrahymena thermophila SB210]|uniref:MFS transporter n=1 Tax=Tetrahymena thermophila (strain SB210) TaxID=312017 RepID=Q24C65_TETTS|nr:MFS transporter [Tetrahymena thermophila SB210]EAS05373.2 MFS transporter [Tetrahymena thermophila SB210]|eukprot:XP_001025618.2 MFS transporter [Tetrahymena thermophila SB210]
MKLNQILLQILISFSIIKQLFSQILNEANLLLLSASPISIVELKQYQSGAGFHIALTPDNNYAFLSCLTGGFLVFNVSNPFNPSLIIQVKGYDVRYIALDSQYAYVVDDIAGLSIYNIQNINQINIVGQMSFSQPIQSALKLKKSDTLLVIGNGIMFSVDVSEKTQPKILSQSGTSNSACYDIIANKEETFAFASQGQFGVGIYNISNLNKIQQIILQTPNWIVYQTALHQDEDILYVVDGWYGLYYADISSVTSPNPPSTLQLVFNVIVQYPGFVISGAILSSDKKYLVFAIKSVGFKIYDISSQPTMKKNPQIVYQLDGSYLMKSFVFSSNNNYFLINNGLELVIHKQVTPNLNRDFPNIFNSFQSTLTFLGIEFWPYHLHIFQDGKTAAVNVGLIGTKLYDISDIDHPVWLSTIKSQGGTSQDYVYAQPSNENILFVGGSQLGVHIYDITDKKNPNLITTYAPNPNLQNNSDGFDMNEDRSIVIIGNSEFGIGLADFRDYKNPKKYSNLPSLLSSNVKKVKLSKNSKYAYLASLEVGLIILDISDPYQPKMASAVFQMAGETVKLSSDENYAYLSNGFTGITIINIQNPFQPFIVSSIPVDGWAIDSFTMFNEKYIIACTAEKGQVVAIDISQKDKPHILAKFSILDEHSFSIASTPNYSAAIFIGAKGMRILPLDTHTYIHSQYIEILSNINSSQKQRDMNIGEALKVGSTIQITFASVYTEREIIYENAFNYQNYEIKNLPQYMQFNSIQQQLIIKVDKDQVSSNKLGENIVLLQLSIQITYQQIMAIHPVIQLNLALGIIQCLIQANFLNQQQFLNLSFDPSRPFYLDFYTFLNIPKTQFEPIDQQIQNGIQNLLKYSRILYPIKFFVTSSLIINKNTKLDQVIETPSQSVSVLFTILPKQGQSKPNGAFIKKSFQGVLASFSDSQDQLKLEGSLQNVNIILNQNIQVANLTALEDIQISYTISDGSNFDINSQDSLLNLTFIALNKPVVLNKNIQDQLNNQFSKSGMYVAEQFNFKLDSQTFVDLDSYNNDLIYSAYFVHSNSLEPITETSDKIQFNPRQATFIGIIPQSELFNTYRIRVVASDGYTFAQDEFVMDFRLMPLGLIVQLLFQIIGPIIGVLGLWRYRSFFYRLLMKKQYSYMKEHAYIGEEYRKKIVLMSSIQSDFQKIWKIYKKQNKDYKKKIWESYNQKKAEFLEDLIMELEKIYNQKQKEYPYIQEQEFIFPFSRLNYILQVYILDIYLKLPQNQPVLKGFESLKKKSIQQLKNQKNWYRKYVRINIDSNWKAKKREFETSQNQSQSIHIFDAKDHVNQTQAAISLNVPNQNPFPKVEFLDDLINKDLEECKIICDKNLLKELITFEVYGIIVKQPFRFSPSRGESLHLLSSDLISVNAYIKDKGSCQCIKRCLEIDYKPIGLYHNSPLPSWLECDIIDDVIYLWGTPTNKDIGTVQLRISDLFGFTVMQFDLDIQHKDEQDNPIKKLTSERNIKIQMRQNNLRMPNSNVSNKNQKKSVLEIYSYANSEVNFKQYHKNSEQHQVKFSDNKSEKDENHEILSFEMLSQNNVNDIRSFEYVPSQNKQKTTIQQLIFNKSQAGDDDEEDKKMQLKQYITITNNLETKENQSNQVFQEDKQLQNM